MGVVPPHLQVPGQAAFEVFWFLFLSFIFVRISVDSEPPGSQILYSVTSEWEFSAPLQVPSPP